MAARSYICSSKTKRRIYEVAVSLLLEKGFQATTLSDIAEAAEVSTGTLYRYYPSKDDILMEIGRDSVERMKAFAQDIPEETNLFDAVLAVMLEDVRGTRALFYSRVSDDGEGHLEASDVRLAHARGIYSSKEHLDVELATRTELSAVYAGLVEAAKERGEFSSNVDSRVYGQIIVAVFFAELDKGIYRYDYPYEFKFREKLEALFEGKMHDELGE